MHTAEKKREFQEDFQTPSSARTSSSTATRGPSRAIPHFQRVLFRDAVPQWTSQYICFPLDTQLQKQAMQKVY